MTDNQRSGDVREMLVFRTPGPVVYRDPEVGAAAGGDWPDDVPHIYTPATVEVVDRRNLPRLPGRDGSATGVLVGDDLRKPGQVADILAGKVLPPPTVTATGMKIYLTPNAKNPKPGEKKSQVGFTGVRRMELGSRVQFNLWSDGASGFPGAGSAAASQGAGQRRAPRACSARRWAGSPKARWPRACPRGQVADRDRDAGRVPLRPGRGGGRVRDRRRPPTTRPTTSPSPA